MEASVVDCIGNFRFKVGLALLIVSLAGSGAIAEDAGWRIAKTSGDVWVANSGVQRVSLTDKEVLNPGDNIRTGRNGRVLLVRVEETMLVAPNSVIGIPAEKKEGLSTTIIQQAGSILLDVEKRNVKHFEVETPYLAAVVKGTQFRVSVNRTGTSVDVLRGAVEVADFKSGKFATVLPGQAARVSAQGEGGLSLSGSGVLSPIQQGTPRATSVTRVPVPAGGLSVPRGHQNPGVRAAHDALRIAAPVGEVKLDFQKVTKGLARAETVSNSARGNADKPTVWTSGELTPGNGAGKAYGLGNGNGNANANTNANANANANGGSNGNGNAYGAANGNNGNGNGKGKGKKS